MIFPLNVESFVNVEAFYAAAPDQARRYSGEADYGLYWYEGRQAYSGSWKVAVVENTGEIYVECQREGPVGEVVVLGVIGPDPGYEHADDILEGWAQVCGSANSMQWVIDRTAPLRGRAPHEAAALSDAREVLRWLENEVEAGDELVAVHRDAMRRVVAALAGSVEAV